MQFILFTYSNISSQKRPLCAGWQLVFIHFCLFVNNLALISCNCQNAPTYPQAQIYFVFLILGNPKTVLKGGYSVWRGGSSIASRKLKGLV